MKLQVLKIGILMLTTFAFTQVKAQDQERPNKKERPSQEELFAKLDVNNDGGLSLEEFKNRKRKKEVDAEKMEKRFTKIDADANGLISLEEFQAGATKKGGKRRGKGRRAQE